MILTRRVTLLFLLLASCAVGVAQQTTSFTYQGRLTDGGSPANGSYDLQFTLWDAVSGGTQQPQPASVTVTKTSVAVANGVFTVSLDFGANAFPGANRFLEIGARLSGSGAFTILAPRQPITPTPYAIRSLNASSADAVTVNGVPSGSGNYIQNVTSQQAASNFNISGNGTAGGTLTGGVVNAATQYNLFGARILSADFDNLSLFFGFGGPPPNTGTFNHFLGIAAGISNTSGAHNTFVGFAAGNLNSTGGANTFVGDRAGANNSTASLNSFFGESSGFFNVSGKGNSFFGEDTGFNNTTGSNNTFLGEAAGFNNGAGSFNTFAGYNSGTLGGLTNATAIGANSTVAQDNALVLGSVQGVNGATSSVNVGIGTTTPQNTLHVKGGALIETTGSGGNIQFGTPNAETGFTIIKAATGRADLRFDGSILKLVNNAGTSIPPATSGIAITSLGDVGIGTTTPTEKLSVNGSITTSLSVIVGNLISLTNLGSGGSVALCRNAQLIISTCSSSLRYKKEITHFSGGLNLIRQLHPITFSWKSDGTRDLGLGAEDVAKVEPLLVTRNNKGEIEGVKYDHLNVVLINAIKQQQEQIERQQKLIKQQEVRLTGQQQQLASLKRLVCLNHPRASVCKKGD